MEDVIACDKVCLVSVISSPVIGIYLPWWITFLDRGCVPSEAPLQAMSFGRQGNLKASPWICCLSGANSSHTYMKINIRKQHILGIPCPAMPQWLWVTLYLPRLWMALSVCPIMKYRKPLFSITVGLTRTQCAVHQPSCLAFSFSSLPEGSVLSFLTMKHKDYLLQDIWHAPIAGCVLWSCTSVVPRSGIPSKFF